MNFVSMLLGSKVARFIGGVALALAAFFGATAYYTRKGRLESERDQALREAKENQDAHDRLNRADVSAGDSSADAEWLRDRASGQRD